MKICPRCDKPISIIAANNSYCWLCYNAYQRAYMRKWRAKNRRAKYAALQIVALRKVAA